ncbi:hypothetical protein GCM10018790_63260 [Kitasatospora xanthocidica]|nr:hypothetical protein GCM10018790_63260 [Kitasatospora xanthocidica]
MASGLVPCGEGYEERPHRVPGDEGAYPRTADGRCGKGEQAECGEGGRAGEEPAGWRLFDGLGVGVRCHGAHGSPGAGAGDGAGVRVIRAPERGGGGPGRWPGSGLMM